MAKLDGTPSTSDIDAIASSSGLLVEVKPGNILINKNGSNQNIAITRSEDLFVAAGQTKTIQGLYGACIDAHDGIPDYGDSFDVAPPLEQWVNIVAAQYLQQLLDSIDINDLYCPSDYLAQESIWRISDNEMGYNEEVDSFLLEVGIDIGEQLLDFPRMNNPYSDSLGSFILIPPELYVFEFDMTPHRSQIPIGM